jgi:hypothetical protein
VRVGAVGVGPESEAGEPGRPYRVTTAIVFAVVVADAVRDLLAEARSHRRARPGRS